MDPEPLETQSPSELPPTTSSPRRKSFFLPVAIVLVLLLLAGIAGAYFWYNRPITPVELTKQEVETVEEKIESLESDPAEPEYVPGSKEIILTERELNGLINENTELGDQLVLTLGTGEIHARIDTDMDQNMPILGGKKIKAKARFLVETKDGGPSLVLDDLTVWGASVPNEWLGGMKGKDLLTEIFGKGGGIRGIEDLRIERGRLVIKLAD